MTRLPINIKQDKSICQELKLSSTLNQDLQSKTILKTEQDGDLYGDRFLQGLIHPIDSYCAEWTVELDRGGYEAVDVRHIFVDEFQPSNLLDVEVLDDASESNLAQLQQEIIALRRENAQLRQENELIKKDLDQAKQIIRRARDISPIMRVSLKRVLRLAHDACMDVQRTAGGWILKMGGLARKFRRLADIWDLLSQDDFLLNEIFPKDKLIAVELILPPKKRKPEPPEKKTFPLMCPSDERPRVGARRKGTRSS